MKYDLLKSRLSHLAEGGNFLPIVKTDLWGSLSPGVEKPTSGVVCSETIEKPGKLTETIEKPGKLIIHSVTDNLCQEQNSELPDPSQYNKHNKTPIKLI